MNTVFIAVCRDRHVDDDITAYRTMEDAIDYARKFMNEHVSFPEFLREETTENGFFITYDLESDCAQVIELEY